VFENFTGGEFHERPKLSEIPDLRTDDPGAEQQLDHPQNQTVFHHSEAVYQAASLSSA